VESHKGRGLPVANERIILYRPTHGVAQPWRTAGAFAA